MENKKQEIKVNFPQDFKGGFYANNMVVTHTKNEFIVDFIMLAHPIGIVGSRVITSPEQAKLIIEALKENVSKYEKKFGEIKTESQSPESIDFDINLKQ